MSKDEEIADLKEKLQRAKGARDALLDVVKDRAPAPILPYVVQPPMVKCWTCGALYRGWHTCNVYAPPYVYPWQPVPIIWGMTTVGSQTCGSTYTLNGTTIATLSSGGN